ncbi:MAG: hypothetical protein WAR81_18325 [Pseudomonadales bacterium]|jgi:hypothetical protein
MTVRSEIEGRVATITPTDIRAGAARFAGGRGHAGICGDFDLP